MLPLLSTLVLGFTLLRSTTAQFTVTASLPGNTFDGQPLNAAGQAFWIGGFPATYCPTQVNPNCPNVTATVLTAGFGALDVEVPGGQQVYVNVNGALGFTQAHSESVPTGAYIGGFLNVTVTSDCTAPFTVLNWKSPDSSTEGILACPITSTAPNSTTQYQVFAKTPAFNLTNCVTLDGMAPHPYTGGEFGAWQYT